MCSQNVFKKRRYTEENVNFKWADDVVGVAGATFLGCAKSNWRKLKWADNVVGEGCGAAGAVFDKHLVQQTAGQSKLNRCKNTKYKNSELYEQTMQ